MTKRSLFANLMFALLAGSFSSLSAQTFSSAERGIAVFYADYLEGQPTAYGDVYHRDQMTAAHRTYPAGTMLKVTRLDTKRSVVVRVNDRGAYCDGCVVDLSKVAALQLDLLKTGKAMVSVEVIGKQNSAATNSTTTAAKSTVITPVNNGLLTTANSYSRPNAAAAERPANQHSSYPRPYSEYANNNTYTASRSVPSSGYVATEQPVSYSSDVQARTPVAYDQYQPQQAQTQAQTSYNYYQAQAAQQQTTGNIQDVRSSKATYERLQARGLLPETKVQDNDASFYERGNMQVPNSYEHNDEPVVNSKGSPNPSAYIQWNNTPTSTAAPQAYSSASSYPQTYEATVNVPQGKYALQLASYRNIDNAQRQLTALRKKGLNDAYLLETSNSGGKLYKILHGPYGSKEAATQELQHFKSNMLLDGIVILLQ
ncbi:MAG: septal ring lytic transglycosylase RlpA family protein [Saprospiraceae bacterium]